MSLLRRLNQIEAILDKLDPSDPQFDPLNQEGNQIVEELARIDEIFEAERAIRVAAELAKQLEETRKVRTAQHRVRIEAKYGNYDEWYAKSKALYEITVDFKVISHAAQWEEEKYWLLASNVDCLEKVEQLIDYKYYDHFVRKD
jgi:hypothetical protein